MQAGLDRAQRAASHRAEQHRVTLQEDPQPLCSESAAREEFGHVAKTLGFGVDELAGPIAAEPRRHTDHPNAARMSDHNSKWVQVARHAAKGEFSAEGTTAVWNAPPGEQH